MKITFFTPLIVQNGGRGAEGYQRYRLMRKIEEKTILSAKNGMNFYSGCAHGRIYCDSRSDCYGMDYEFEDIGSFCDKNKSEMVAL